MLLLEDKRFYVYVYLDPRKEGKYSYLDGELAFNYEPFYVGEGHGNRYKSHLDWAKKHKTPLKGGRKHNKILKLLRNSLNPIIVKVFENLTKKEGLELEYKLTTSMGLVTEGGILTNLIHGGGKGTKYASKELRDRISKQRKNKSYTEIYNDPKGWITKISIANSGSNNNMYGKYHSELSCKKISDTRIKNKIGVGRDNPRYVEIDYEFLIDSYFSICDRKTIYKNYKNHTGKQLSEQRLHVFLDSLCFPTNVLMYKKQREIYYNFIDTNKYNVGYYKKNYEKLESDYYNNRLQKLRGLNEFNRGI